MAYDVSYDNSRDYDCGVSERYVRSLGRGFAGYAKHRQNRELDLVIESTGRVRSATREEQASARGLV